MLFRLEESRIGNNLIRLLRFFLPRGLRRFPMSRPLAACLFVVFAASLLSLPTPSHSDSFDTTSSAGAGVLSQSFSLSKHFTTTEENFFFDKASKRLPPETRPTSLAYNLGYRLTRSVTPASVAGQATTNVTDLAHSMDVGLNWEATRQADVGASLHVDLIPDEGYRMGGFNFHTSYLILFDPPPPPPPRLPPPRRKPPPQPKPRYVDDDVEEDTEEDLGRTLLVRLNFNVGTHVKDPGTRLTRTTSIGRQQVTETGLGLDLVYSASSAASFRLSGRLEAFDEPLEPVVQSFDSIAAASRLAAMVGAPSYSPVLRGFEEYSVEGGVMVNLSDQWRLNMSARYSIIALTNADADIGGDLALIYRFHPHWSLGFGGAYSTTALTGTGTALLSYIF